MKLAWKERKLTNHSKQIRMVDWLFFGTVQSFFAVQHPGQSQSKIRSKSVNDDWPSSISVLQELDSDQLVDGIEHNFQDTDDQQLQTAHFSQDSSVSNKNCSGGKFRCDQTTFKYKKEEK